MVALATVLLVAVAVRLWLLWSISYVVRPDETFQYLEQGHRLAFGSGVVPWEFMEGARSYLVPVLVAGLMKLAALVSPEPQFYLSVVRLAAILLSLSVVYVGFRLAEVRNGLTVAIVTGGLCAVWFELIYFSCAIMTEELASHTALWGFYAAEQARRGDRRLLGLVGASFGLAAGIRFQIAPAIAVSAAYQCGWEPRRWAVLLAGAVPAFVCVGGGLDWLTWGTPFRSIWGSIDSNVLDSVSASFGLTPWFAYPIGIGLSWWILAVPVVFLAILGAARAPALTLFAATVLVTHSFVGHKEYRFIYPTLMTAPILAGLGAGRILSQLRNGRCRILAAAAFILTMTLGS